MSQSLSFDPAGSMFRCEFAVAGAGFFDIDGAAGACANAPIGITAAAAKEQATERQLLLLTCIMWSP
jgi:hypothetical protein